MLLFEAGGLRTCPLFVAAGKTQLPPADLLGRVSRIAATLGVMGILRRSSAIAARDRRPHPIPDPVRPNPADGVAMMAVQGSLMVLALLWLYLEIGGEDVPALGDRPPKGAIAFHRLDASSHGWDVGILEPNSDLMVCICRHPLARFGCFGPMFSAAARVSFHRAKERPSHRCSAMVESFAKEGPPGEEFMQTQTLVMDWILQPARWQPLRWVAERLRDRTARQRERRQARRRRVAHLTANYFDGTGAASHVVRDVSTNGAFIFADFQWPPGTIVRMTLQVEGHPFPAATLARAIVVRCAQHGIGVQFMPAKKAERRSLANFLKSI